MPGTTLSKTETDLSNRWLHADAFPFPLLESVSVNGTPGLRGIKHLELSLDHPVLAIAGKNGTGKSTILALVALAFHAPKGHYSRNAKSGNWDGRGYYTFKDFIFRGPSDIDLTGINIKWRYRSKLGLSEVPITKRSDKWMHYERRPDRPVHYIGVARCVPAIEASILRSRFRSSAYTSKTVAVSPRALKLVSEILGRPYSTASTLESGLHSVRTCTSSATYSSFNMGAGEDIVLELIALIEGSLDGSLIVIEEVELGLHSDAVRRLARVIVQLAFIKKLQVVVSTHSEAFLDALPRSSRILVQRAGDQHEILYKPTTRLCVSDLSGTSQAELFIYCEDNVAMSILQEALPDALRRRVNILPIGSDSELAGARYIHAKQSLKQKALIVWDGEVTDKSIKGWLKERLVDRGVPVSSISFTRFPGAEKPESSLLKILASVDGRQSLAQELKCTASEAEAHVDALLSLSEAKGAAFCLHERTGLSEESAWDRLVRASVNSPSKPFHDLVEAVRDVLAGSVCQISSALPEA